MSAPLTAQDEAFMRMALVEARRGHGRTRPNPAVGAVVVRANKVVAVGHHRKAGQPHAEAEALTAAGKAAQGATLYVTLEPCCHTGRTGPCADAVIAAGIKRVVVGCQDENPLVSGRGLKRLKNAGIDVISGCLATECQDLNRAFFCWISRGRPLVTLKFACTLDGVMGDPPVPPGEQAAGVRWITSPPARQHAHRLRALHHAILVGRGTVQSDDPQLTVRAPRLPPGGSRALLRVVLDSRLTTSPQCRLLSEPAPGPPPLFVAATPPRAQESAWRKRQAALVAAGAEVLMLPNVAGAPALNAVLTALAQRQVQSLMVEGGSRVVSAFIAQGLVDRVVAYVAPKLAGGGVSLTNGPGRTLAQALPLTNMSTARIGPDLLITADVVRLPSA